MKHPYFGRRIEPACDYCEWGWPSKDGKNILCPKCGIVSPGFSCRKYRYAPLKRQPKTLPPLPQYDPDEFRF